MDSVSGVSSVPTVKTSVAVLVSKNGKDESRVSCPETLLTLVSFPRKLLSTLQGKEFVLVFLLVFSRFRLYRFTVVYNSPTTYVPPHDTTKDMKRFINYKV